VADLDAFIFGVDLDGVCADYTLGLQGSVSAHTGRPRTDFPIERDWDFTQWGFGPGDFEYHHRRAVATERMFRTLEVIPGAAEALWSLSDAGVWIRVITHRLYVNWGHQAAVADTVAWLDDARIPYRDLCFLGAKPQVEADLYIDDSPSNITGLRKAGNDVIVFDQPYNRDMPGPVRATGARSRRSSWIGTRRGPASTGCSRCYPESPAATDYTVSDPPDFGRLGS
jgi:5'(3')-deoxyribonucleotidase